MSKKTNSQKINTGTILKKLLEGDFFNEWKTTSDVIKKLNNKGFTIKGKKIGMISRLLTQMCQKLENNFEREEIPKKRRVGVERWMFKKVKQ